ncbi:hypothetical protein [Photobacterium damselae]|uniref:hypothetical protein n=1 Tax=Photobacterium damselae TaxID=38293 RepID=UPI000D05F1F4|nr:hypothetical protein [Photobacterium damselae]PSB80585.1 hypothetical protein C5F62_14590 [Photobacterium damselae subsp. damselae]
MKVKLFCLILLCFFSKTIIANEVVSQKSIIEDASTGDSYLKITVNDWSAYILYGEEQNILELFDEKNKKNYKTEINQNTSDESEVVNIENIESCNSQQYVIVTVRTFLSCESCELANYVYERYIFNIKSGEVSYLFDDESKKAAGELPLRFVKKLDKAILCK